MNNKNRLFYTLLSFTTFVAILLFTQPVFSQGSARTPLEDHRVLLLGDSQVAGAFGTAMTYELTAHGVVYYTRSGQPSWGVPRWLANRTEIRRLIQRHEPTLLLIELGGNDFLRSRRTDYVDEVRELWDYVNQQMQEIHGDSDTNWRIIWIAPATTVGSAADIQPGRDRAAETILSVVTDRNYVESRDITGEFGRTADGIHFTSEGGADWARRVRPRIEDCLERRYEKVTFVTNGIFCRFFRPFQC